jgi:hypothetical protein
LVGYIFCIIDYHIYRDIFGRIDIIVRVYLIGYIFCIIDYHIYRDIFGRIDIIVRVYLVGYIYCIIDYHICRDIFDMIDIMYYRLPYVSRDVLPLKTPAPLYICTSIKQYNHLTFGGTHLSNSKRYQLRDA